MSDDDTELRDVVTQALEQSGVLGNMRAQLRARVFLALEEHDSHDKKNFLEHQELKEFIQTKNGKLAFSLVKQFLQHFNLQHTLSVLQPEAGLQDSSLIDTNSLMKDLHLDSSLSAGKKGPLLASVVAQTASAGGSLRSLGSSVQDLTPEQVEEARRKFRQFDKDKNGLIDKEELRSVFMSMFPHFNQNMLERYVNDEFRSTDKDFSNSIDFDEFIGLHKRLFTQCRSVVALDTGDILSPRSTSLSARAKSRTHENDGDTPKLVGDGVTIPERKRRKPRPAGDTVSDTISGSRKITSPGSSLDEDPFFDDHLPDSPSRGLHVNQHRNGDNEDTTKSHLQSSLKDAPPLFTAGKSSGPTGGAKGDGSSFQKKLAELGLEELDNADYQDDFDDSPSQKTLSPRTDLSKKSQGSLEEEIDEVIDVEDEVVNSQSVADDLCTDVTVDSDRSLGVDYIEDTNR